MRARGSAELRWRARSRRRDAAPPASTRSRTGRNDRSHRARCSTARTRDVWERREDGRNVPELWSTLAEWPGSTGDHDERSRPRFARHDAIQRDRAACRRTAFATSSRSLHSVTVCRNGDAASPPLTREQSTSPCTHVVSRRDLGTDITAQRAWQHADLHSNSLVIPIFCRSGSRF